MSKKHRRYMVTAALPYANGPLHIGHLAGAYLPADIYARQLRLAGEDVLFICGSDEHGAAITMKARKEDKSPREIIDLYHEQFEKTFQRLGIKFDKYSRTSEAIHHETAQLFFSTLYEKGAFEEIVSEQYYDAEASSFLADRYITGTCPKCNYHSAYGDQCEQCGSTLNPTDLINPKSTLSGNKPILKKTSHWYLSLEKHEEWLREWIEQGKLEGEKHHDPKKWKAHVMGQCKSWLDAGLQPRAMTRDLDWGVDVPSHIPHSEGKKLYVWMDAPIGYISATKVWAEETGKDWKPYWQDKDTALVHFIGKDNIVFHCLIFPAILKAHGDYILPVNVPANQFMNLEEQKISTSRNWAIWAHEYIEDAEGKVNHAVDVLRYALIRNMPEQKDADFSWDQFRDLNDSELVGKLANFVNRVFVLTHKHYNGKVPEFFETTTMLSSRNAEQITISREETEIALKKLKSIGKHIRTFEFRNALRYLIMLAEQGNALLQFNEPWKWIKTDSTKPAATINTAWQIVNLLRYAMHPFMPDASKSLSRMMNLPEPASGDLSDVNPDSIILPSGHQIGEAEHLFTKIDPAFLQHRKDLLNATEKLEAQHHYQPVKPEIEFDDFSKLDLRCGTIISADKVKKADKLLQLNVDLGFEQRTVISGIAQHFKPEEIVGERVVVVANLKPRKMRGVESKGMILMAESNDEKLTFVRPDQAAQNGDPIS